jgi:cytochrome c oxidase cbb3-type subunit 4
MNKQWVVNFTDAHLTELGLIIFFLFFVSVLFWVNRLSSKNLYAQLEKSPFEKGDQI